jgi:hypothetical protein
MMELANRGVLWQSVFVRAIAIPILKRALERTEGGRSTREIAPLPGLCVAARCARQPSRGRGTLGSGRDNQLAGSTAQAVKCLASRAGGRDGGESDPIHAPNGKPIFSMSFRPNFARYTSQGGMEQEPRRLESKYNNRRPGAYADPERQSRGYL